MKKLTFPQSTAIALGLSLFAAAGCDQAGPNSPSGSAPANRLFAQPGGGGNGAPPGAHFNLNLLGMQKGKTANMSGGSKIFIYYEGVTKIMLKEGDYAVLDANGTDGTAQFQLPNPDPEGDGGQLAYSVWIRPVAGKGSVSFATCFTETSSNSVYCYAGSLVQNLTKNNKFSDVSKDLLQVCADVDTTDGIDLELVPLFSDLGEDYFWEVDNNGMRNVQMRFYPLSTTPIGGDCTQTVPKL